MPGLIPLMLNADRSSVSSSPRLSSYLSPPATPIHSKSPVALDFSTVLDVSFPLPKLSPRVASFPKSPRKASLPGSSSPERVPSRLATSITCSSSAPSSPLSEMSVSPLDMPSPVSLPSNMPSSSTTTTPSSSSPKSRRIVPAPLPSIPYTSSEWCMAISEVKRQYISRRFRACAARCSEILDNLRNPSQVEPIYIICLNYYAANALEMNARPLPASSAFRQSLLQRALTHYRKAAEMLKDEDDNIPEDSRRLSVLTGLAVNTPMSVSRTWTPSMCSSSRSPSICSLEDPKDSAPAPIKKRVKFSCDIEDPVIRPDSPTLGFDDFIGRSSPEPVVIPRVPMHITAMPPSALKQPKPINAIPAAVLPKGPSTSDAQQLFSDEDLAVGRFCALLSSLRAEVTSHLAAVEAMVAQPNEDEDMIVVSGRSTPIDMFKDSEEMRSLDIRARIERLRQNNWQRRRFDARKYEMLAESALAELS
ncbi:hypothetical protein TD95_000001 [Thielaviopsis punctulata]|uniref:Uncharacterized protein n=1 Tax=Thielaviopsis punctulata TaxID=72032 RepID=A0A0F4Z7H7_9PEZI|nr:hypothetical protein TD95_000001 [Thielaviopsis punctulata]